MNRNSWDYPFYVNEHVLIPRQDTEVLVEEAIQVIQKEMPEAWFWICVPVPAVLESVFSVFLFKHTGDSSGYFRGCVEGCTEERKRESGAEAEFVHSDLFKKISGNI